MKNFAIKLRKKTRSDKADAILTFFILTISVVIFLVFLVTDINKNTYIKTGYASIAQDAVERGVSKINNDGSLTEAAVQEVVKSYAVEKKKSQLSTYSYSDKCTTIKRTYNEPDVSGNFWKTQTKDKRVPFMIITLSTGRNYDGPGGASSITYVSEGGDPARRVSGFFVKGAKYNVISAQIYDSSDNFMSGVSRVVTKDTSAKYGSLDCQVYANSVSAISFGSNSDIKK